MPNVPATVAACGYKAFHKQEGVVYDMDVVEKLPKWGTYSTMESGVSVQQNLAPGSGLLFRRAV
jgi:hypothetical protein